MSWRKHVKQLKSSGTFTVKGRRERVGRITTGGRPLTKRRRGRAGGRGR